MPWPHVYYPLSLLSSMSFESKQTMGARVITRWTEISFLSLSLSVITDEESESSPASSSLSGLISVVSPSAAPPFAQQQQQQQRAYPVQQGTACTSPGGTTSIATPITPVPVVPSSQLSPISPTLPAGQQYTADVCHQYYNAYNYAAAAAAGGKMRTTSPYGRSAAPGAYQPYHHHPHQNVPTFPHQTPFYSRTVQNPYDYSPR